MLEMFKPALMFVLARSKEPSTYAGVAVALTALGMNVDPGTVQTISSVGVAVSSAAAVFMKG